jgi:hypothetical protein
VAPRLISRDGINRCEVSVVRTLQLASRRCLLHIAGHCHLPCTITGGRLCSTIFSTVRIRAHSSPIRRLPTAFRNVPLWWFQNLLIGHLWNIQKPIFCNFWRGSKCDLSPFCPAKYSPQGGSVARFRMQHWIANKNFFSTYGEMIPFRQALVPSCRSGPQFQEVGPSFPASEFHDVLLLSSQTWTRNRPLYVIPSKMKNLSLTQQ